MKQNNSNVTHTWNAQNERNGFRPQSHEASLQLHLFSLCFRFNWPFFRTCAHNLGRSRRGISLLWVCRRRSVKCPLINTIIHFHLLDSRGLLTFTFCAILRKGWFKTLLTFNSPHAYSSKRTHNIQFFGTYLVSFDSWNRRMIVALCKLLYFLWPSKEGTTHNAFV